MSFNKLFISLSLIFCASSFAQSQPPLPSSFELAQAVRNNPNDSTIYFQYGIALSHEHKDSDAIIVFEKLLSNYPKSASLYNNLAVVYAHQQNFDKTEELLKNALKYSPNYDTGYENLADLYAKLAEMNYQKAYDISKRDILISKVDGLNKVLFLNEDTTVASNNTASKNSEIGKVNLNGLVNVAPTTTIAPKTAVDNLPSDSVKANPTTITAVTPAIANTVTASIADKNTTSNNVDSNSNITVSEVTHFLDSWKTSWEKKDIQKYLSFYDSTFKSGHINYSQWVSQRTKNISAQKDIIITLSNIKVDNISQTIHVTFNQQYKSKTIASSTDHVDYVVKKINNQLKFVEKI